MTPPDSEVVAQKAPPTKELDELQAEVNTKVRKELEAIATDLEEYADRLIKLYGDLSLDGESQAFAYRTVARDLRNRVRLLP